MDKNVLITVATLGVMLLIAYQHRRQMRQVELYRADPTVGVHPPESGFIRAIKGIVRFVGHNLTWFAAATNIALIVRELMRSEPLDRGDAGFLVLCGVGAAVNISMGIAFKVELRTIAFIREVAKVLATDYMTEIRKLRAALDEKKP